MQGSHESWDPWDPPHWVQGSPLLGAQDPTRAGIPRIPLTGCRDPTGAGIPEIPLAGCSDPRGRGHFCQQDRLEEGGL